MTDHTRIAASARSWVGTRFKHQGRLKKTDAHAGGVDCLGLLVGIARECELMARSGEPLHLLDETDYSHKPDTRRLLLKLRSALVEVSEIQAGAVVVMEVMNSPQHLGIVVEGEHGLHLIHAYAQAGRVVEHPLDDHWRGMVRSVHVLAKSSAVWPRCPPIFGPIRGVG